MAQPGMFDELSTRMNKGKRPDSGIHNSVELTADEVRSEDRLGNSHQADDSGQESADQTDSSANMSGSGGGKKKPGFLKSFKKIFKKKKPSSKSTKRNSEEGGFREQYKANSETDVFADPAAQNHAEGEQSFRRANTDAAGLSPKKPPRTFTNKENVVDADDEKNSEKKNSLKDAQQYIRSSLRKLKGKKSEKTDDGGAGDVTAESANIENVISVNDHSSNRSFSNASFDDVFFSKTLAGDGGDQTNSTNVTVKLGDIRPTSPQTENSVAKDRIRVAPQNRRKPSRYQGNAPPKPARTTNSFSFKDESLLPKIDEDKDNFTSVSRNNSNVSRHDSGRGSHPSFSRSDSENTNRSSLDSSVHQILSSDHIPRALLNKHSFSTADDMESKKPRSLAQRSFSTNSRENINRPKPPVKPPRSANTSSTSLNTDESLVKNPSLNDLRNRLFYTDINNKIETKNLKNSSEKNNSATDIRDKIRFSNEQNFGNERLSYGDKQNSFENKRDSYEEKRNSNGDKRESYGDKRNSFENKRDSYGEKRGSFGSKRDSYGDKRNSHGGTQTPLGDNKRDSRGSSMGALSQEEKRTSYTDKKRSSENLSNETSKRNSYDRKSVDSSSENKRESYGAIFGLSNSHSSLSEKTILTEVDQNIVKSTNTGSKGYTNLHEDETPDRLENHELFFPKLENPRDGMLAFALTSPRQDRKLDSESSAMLRSKSMSEKLEKTETHPPRVTARYSDINSSKSVGHINEIGSKSSSNIDHSAPVPRKLRKPSPPVVKKREKKEESAPEFHRISLRKVPKLEDYMGSSEPLENKTETPNTSSDILDFINNELVLDEQPSRQSVVDQFNVSHSEELPNRTKLAGIQNNAGVKERETKSSVAFNSSPLTNLDLTSTEEKYSDDRSLISSDRSPVSNDRSVASTDRSAPTLSKTKEQPELRRASWKNIDEKQTAQQSPEFKRHSIKKIEIPTAVESPKASSLPTNRGPEINMDQQERPPRPLVKNRPTVHVTKNRDFSFQSNDVKSRSKSLSGADQKRLTEKAANETDSTEPEWFKLARKKQKNEEVEDDYVTQHTPPRNTSVEMNRRPTSPPVKPKPKVSPRPPPVGSKPEVNSRPPAVAKKPQVPVPDKVGSSPTRAARPSFNAKAEIAKDQCLVCGRKAYPFERIDVEKRVVHKNCAKCEECSRKLNIGGIFVRDDKVYCSNHK